MRKRIVWVAAIVGALVAVTATIAVASGDGEGGVSGPEADRAVQAALEVTGGGTANAVELDGEGGGTWEVEVATPAGTVVDVRLDEGFALVSVEGDVEVVDDGNDED